LREGENNNNLFIILTGKIILSSLSKSNKRTYLSSLKENSLVGLNGALNNQPELTTATTNKESTIAILGTKALETVLKNPKTLKILNDTLKGQRSDEHLKKITHKKSTKLTEKSFLHSIKNKLFKKKKNS
jgi:CRP-like cAMP-binding protein